MGSGLMLTVLLRPKASVAGLTTMALALAAADAVEVLTGVSPRLKWPNDLVWSPPGGPDRKLAGILAEAEWPSGSAVAGGWSAPSPTERVAVAAGIGLNVTWSGAKPVDLAQVAVALDEIVDRDRVPARIDLLVALLRSLDDRYGTLHAGPGGVAEIRSAWRERSATLGRRVRVDLGADDVVGTAVDITDEGHLVVDAIDGRRRSLAVGDVVHLRSEA